MKLYRALVVIYGLLLMTQPLSAAEHPEVIDLTVHETYVVDTTSEKRETALARVSVSNPDVAAVQVNEGHVFTFALQRGVSQINVWHTDQSHQQLNVHVYSEQRYMLDQFLNLFLPSNRIQRIATPSRVWLSGQARYEEAERLKSLAATFEELDVSQLELLASGPEMVEMEVHVVEFNRRFLKQQGLSWSASAQGPAFGLLSDWLGGRRFRLFYDTGETWQPSVDELGAQSWQGISTYLGIQTQLSSTLRLLEERGQA